MKVSHQTIDVVAERIARKRIAVARLLLGQTDDLAEREALQAEIDRLDGSWITTEQIERTDVLTEAEGIAADQAAAKEAERQAIRDELAANDAKAMRAFFEGDQGRIGAHNEAQAELRKRLAAI